MPKIKAEREGERRVVFNLKKDIWPRLVADCGRRQAQLHRRYTPTEYINDLLEERLPPLAIEPKAAEPKGAEPKATKLVRAVGR